VSQSPVPPARSARAPTVGRLPADGGSVSGEEPLLTVAIATYNGRHLLEVVLPSLAVQSLRRFRVVVVDDASQDDTHAWLAEHWPEVELIVHPRNLGVTAALNSCLRAGDTELVGLFNNDLELHPDCLAELVLALEHHPGAASATPKLLDFYARDVLDGAGDIFTWGGEAHRRGKGERDEGQYDEPRPIFGACGGAAVYRRSALGHVGLMDEAMFANYEDADWSFRAQLAGYKCRYVPSAVAYHMGSATLGAGPSDFSLYHNWRNSIWVVIKNYSARDLVLHAPALLLVQIRNLAIVTRRGRTRLWLRVWRDALGGLPTVLVKRRAVQRSRLIGRRELREVIGR
jgi:GT2 family glycosyltransferase